MKTLQEILARKAELRTLLEDPKADLAAIEKELRELNDLQNQIEKRDKLIKEAGEIDNGDGTGSGGLEQRSQSQPVGAAQVLGAFGISHVQNQNTEERKKFIEKLEQRGADLKAGKTVTFDLNEMPELRGTTITSGTLVVPSQTSNTLNDTFNQVSSLIDMVNAVPLGGGESYKKGFVISDGTGDYTTEGDDYAGADTTFGYVDIVKSNITAYTEISKAASVLPSADYQAYVKKGVVTSLRKKIAGQIIAAVAGANSFTGIYNAPANVIPPASDIVISEIDADTLDLIVFGYGGNEDVEGEACLCLNKKDLAAFAAVRTADGEKLYKIKKKGNRGTISSDDSFEVQFCINSACNALSDAAVNAGQYTMVYGYPTNYEMPIFSAVTVEESREYKFKSGQIAYRADVFAGGNVAAYKGFVRVKKG